MWKAKKKEGVDEQGKPKKRNVKVERERGGGRKENGLKLISEGTCLDMGCLAKDFEVLCPVCHLESVGNSLDLSLCVLASPPVVLVVTLPSCC